MDAQRALLDELMGTARNLTEEERKGYKEIKWDDKEVCGFYMVRFCPHDLFVNTRSDLGVCPRIHDPKLKESFEKSPRHDSYVPKFEAELAHFCEKLVSDLDRRVRRGQERLEQEIKNLLEQVESLGETGKVDEAEALMRKVDTLNAEKTALAQQPQQDKLLMIAQEKKMALCEICGSFLVANDAAERTQSHVTGKQHMGYGMVRDFLSKYKAAKEKAREEQRLAREKEAEERKKQREREYDSRLRSDSADRDRYHDRDYDRERERYRERSHERNGRGSREGGRGSDWNYSNSRNERDGSREIYRERDRSRSRSPVRAWPKEVIWESHSAILEDCLDKCLNFEFRRALLKLYHLSIINIVREKVQILFVCIGNTAADGEYGFLQTMSCSSAKPVSFLFGKSV
ncbi:LUC7 N terminus domain-containing protein [Abeliophyllum distichum]|uniref:LUC7 N terminus domain-containing protein n=1 Tax=Abeliophyllum distichum TaxID=126358 RepID=A0ABD1VRS9_9LAMI